MTCKHYYSCAHYCALTESCDYLLDEGRRRPHRPENCPGYPISSARPINTLLLPGSCIFPSPGPSGRRLNV